MAALLGIADVILTILPGSSELDELASEREGLTGSLRRGVLWIDLTSTDPAVLDRIAAACRVGGIDFVAAPMRGSIGNAVEGSLRFYAAGRKKAVMRAELILQILGGPDAVTVVSPRPADAATVKLIANQLWFGQVVATTEALLLGQALGMRPSRLATILRDSPGGSTYLNEHVDALMKGDYLETFALDRVIEELRILRDHAANTGTPFEVSALILDLHERARQRFGPAHGELLAAKLLEEQAGTTLRDPSDSTSH